MTVLTSFNVFFFNLSFNPVQLSGHIRNYSFSLEATNFDEDDDEDDDDEDDVPIGKCNIIINIPISISLLLKVNNRSDLLKVLVIGISCLSKIKVFYRESWF